ncbi:MAG TPA: response regulator [Longimicrobiaceae bacterium]|jgi:CheY-like chemotaxis protein|nr:response regulator [Longimicrobiaceae bacterium]
MNQPFRGSRVAVQTVLLVEDNEDNRMIYSTALRHFGFAVVEAFDGEQGIELAQEHNPAVILMDVTMPGIDGWEATRRIKAIPQTAHIPVIALTARAFGEDRRTAAEAGCDGFLTKPIAPREVVDAVRKALGQPAT